MEEPKSGKEGNINATAHAGLFRSRIVQELQKQLPDSFKQMSPEEMEEAALILIEQSDPTVSGSSPNKPPNTERSLNQVLKKVLEVTANDGEHTNPTFVVGSVTQAKPEVTSNSIFGIFASLNNGFIGEGEAIVSEQPISNFTNINYFDEISYSIEGDKIFVSAPQLANYYSNNIESALYGADADKDNRLNAKEVATLQKQLPYTSPSFAAELSAQLGEGSISLSQIESIKASLQQSIAAPTDQNRTWKTPEQIDVSVAEALLEAETAPILPKSLSPAGVAIAQR